MGTSSPSKLIEPLRQHVVTNDGRRRGVVLGATGATGRFLVYHLLKSKEWSRVTIIHRRKMDIDELQKSIGQLTEEELLKLTQHEVDMNSLADENNAHLFENHDTCFCVLGITRDIAGTAENFRKVDLYMVRDGAIACKKAHVNHFSLLTSQGANANIWANDWKITHGLLYLKTKGEAENAVIQQKLPRTSIFRPGPLNRPGTDRMIEKILVPSSAVHVSDLAKVMIMDAESTEITDNTTAEPPLIYENNKIQEMATLCK